MNKQEIMSELEQIFMDVFAREDIQLSETTSTGDVEGWDSLMHITILEAVQNQYSIAFELDEIVEMKTVGDILQAIVSKIS